MFDNRWDNWTGDFAESFGAAQIHPAARNHVPEILGHFGKSVRAIDTNFPDSVRPGTFASVIHDEMPRLRLPDAAKGQVPEVVALFLEYLQETGRLGEGDEWAGEIRRAKDAPRPRGKPEGVAKGVTIRKDPAAAVGRNDPCPCGSGKKFKKCCAT